MLPPAARGGRPFIDSPRCRHHASLTQHPALVGCSDHRHATLPLSKCYPHEKHAPRHGADQLRDAAIRSTAARLGILRTQHHVRPIEHLSLARRQDRLHRRCLAGDRRRNCQSPRWTRRRPCRVGLQLEQASCGRGSRTSIEGSQDGDSGRHCRRRPVFGCGRPKSVASDILEKTGGELDILVLTSGFSSEMKALPDPNRRTAGISTSTPTSQVRSCPMRVHSINHSHASLLTPPALCSQVLFSWPKALISQDPPRRTRRHLLLHLPHRPNLRAITPG
ncbi:hypothetical protein V8E36_009802 [Tilletia maclaganii]